MKLSSIVGNIGLLLLTVPIVPLVGFAVLMLTDWVYQSFSGGDYLEVVVPGFICLGVILLVASRVLEDGGR